MLFGILLKQCSDVGSEQWNQSSFVPYFFFTSIDKIKILHIVSKRSKSSRHSCNVFLKAIKQRGAKLEEVLLRALLEFYQGMQLRSPAKQLNNLKSYRRLEEIRRCSSKELKVTRELLERVRSLKKYATLGKQKSLQYVSGVPGTAYNTFIDEEARDAYFDFEQAIVLNFWVKRVRELGMITSDQLQLGVILKKRAVELSVSKLEGQVRFVRFV